MNFQEMILSLQRFWAAQGCVIWHPYNVQVGAGTNNPATLLRVLGPEPWRVAYVEPSIRPDDGRYGENPNRMQRFLQYQVILKPEPGNPQELYLESLATLGIHARENDIRFVEDNWQSPPLGAWGLGWEVWLNGQEIAQFTYFQQAAGMTCDPVSVEITYGLERMAMAIQGVDSVWDIRWQDELTYGDVYLEEERAHSQYYFEIADVKGLRAVYETYRREHERSLAAGAVLPAYDYVLKCNHIFNVLDARGAVGVTERAQFFRTMQGMTRACANAYLVEREALGFPWREKLKEQWPAVVAPERVSDEVVQTGDFESFLLEIGVEEMPPEHIREVEKQLNTQQNFSPLSSFEIFITPRRIVLYVGHVLLSNLGAIKEFRGPPAKIALDDQGKPTTAAALGFARSKGVTTDDLYSKQEEGGEYIFALVKRPFLEVLAEHVNELLKKLKFSRTMRWNDTGFEFSRPIRWLVALWKDQVVPLKLAGLEADRFTKGHRREGSPLIKLSSASEYLEQMRKCEIQLNKVERQQRVKELLLSELNPNGEKIVEDDELLEEVSSLVENPTVLRCEFDEQFLQLPDVVRTTVMKKHQRYFPIRNVLDYMQPSFLVVCDGAGDEQIRRGYEQVLAARFADTQFFYEQDRKQSLEDFLPRLDTMTFHEKLGSMRDKSQRLEQLVKWLAEEVLGFDTDVIKVAEQAARLCKADLATQMVVELTSLQGEMGRIYAREDGIAEEVAQAIYEHWLPRHADDTLPESKPGILLALADRLDSLVGLMGVGWEATGSSDPYGLRRAARGVIRLLIEKNIDVSFSDICNIARFFPPSVDITKLIEEVLEFLKERLYFRLVELTPGLEIDEFDSGLYTVGGEGGSMTEMHRLNAPRAIMNVDENSVRPWRAAKRLEKFVPWVVSNDKWAQILNGYERCARISQDAEEIPIQASLFKEAAEVALYREYLQAREEVDQEKDVDALLGAMEAMLPAITRFFDEILVMSEEEHIRRNRLALLQGISNLPNGIVDLRAMFRN